MKYFRDALINPSYRRKPVSITLKPLDSGIRRNDGDRINQSFLSLVIYLLCVCIAPPVLAEETLDLDGMSIIGNRELPKALFIVPWKNPEAALAPDRPVNSLVNNTLQPVDPDVFRRKLQYFDAVHKNSSSYTAETP